jgi:acetyl-CoA carboxylase carboxyl transferase subunit alpha
MNTPDYSLEFEKPLRELAVELDTIRQRAVESSEDVSVVVKYLEKKISKLEKDIYASLTPWQRVQIARHAKRPYALDYINQIFEDFQELHGDRQYSDDRALIGGTAFFEGQAVMIVAHQKGRDTKEKISRNFGMPHPEGYRKALRLMRMAEKFKLPLITFIDTPGAFPGVASEERHVSEAIAVNLREMAMLKTPTISIVVGEGGSGGALGIGVTDKVLMFENSYYSVISPEGCAAILWKDGAAAPKAAEALKLGAPHLFSQGIIDEVIAEPVGGAHRDHAQMAAFLKRALGDAWRQVIDLKPKELVDRRYERLQSYGRFTDTKASK